MKDKNKKSISTLHETEFFSGFWCCQFLSWQAVYLEGVKKTLREANLYSWSPAVDPWHGLGVAAVKTFRNEKGNGGNEARALQLLQDAQRLEL